MCCAGLPQGQCNSQRNRYVLNITDFNNDLNVARLSIIPHGNSVLALGKSIEDTSGPVTIPFGSASIAPIGGNLGYAEGPQFTIRQFPEFDQSNPNQILADTVSKQTLNSVTTFIMSTNNGTGGILNIPFIQNNVKAANMDCIFWIEEVADGAGQFCSCNIPKPLAWYSLALTIHKNADYLAPCGCEYPP